MRIKWDDRDFLKQVQTARVRTLKKAAVFLVGEVKKSFGNTGIAGATKADRAANRSMPGDPPNVDTGTLRRSITHELLNESTARVGSNIKYAPALELGTKNMAPRPYLRPAVANNRRKIVKMFKDIF